MYSFVVRILEVAVYEAYDALESVWYCDADGASERTPVFVPESTTDSELVLEMELADCDCASATDTRLAATSERNIFVCNCPSTQPGTARVTARIQLKVECLKRIQMKISACCKRLSAVYQDRSTVKVLLDSTQARRRREVFPKYDNTTSTEGRNGFTPMDYRYFEPQDVCNRQLKQDFFVIQLIREIWQMSRDLYQQ